MKEILFRGKRADNGEWVEGFYMYYQVSPIKGQQFHTITNGKLNWCGLLDKTNILPETVGQYTGLTDKNGKKIFEGDIIKYTRTKWNEPLHSDNGIDLVSFHEIYYDENEGSFKQRHYTDKGNLIASGFLSSFIDVRADENIIEVVGNIYDNLELLNK